MNVRFKIQDTIYCIESTTYEMHLGTITKVKEGKNIGQETFNHVGYHKNVFECLKSIPDVHLINSECKTMLEVGKTYTEVVKRLNEIADELELRK